MVTASDKRRETLLAYIDDPTNVSPDQRAAVVHPGRFFLSACPGAGKTRTVGVRVAYWSVMVDEELGRARRVASTSYTNTAVREIAAAADGAGQPIAEPHFVGTLHRFLLRYVVRPFAAVPMQCEGVPRVVADPAGRHFAQESFSVKVGWTTAPVSVWDLHWRPNGTVTVSEIPYALTNKITPDQLTALLQQDGVEAKLALAERGLMSMSDVLYWAMRALENPDVAKAVSGRFDELIVDEVQDTGDLQQRCIRLLHGAGLRSLVYAGDMEQAIYGFAHAEPADLQALIDETTDATLALVENWRSSQAICDVTFRFSTRPAPDVAVGPHKDAGHPPELIVYPENDEQQAVDVFLQRAEQADVDIADSVVLCRWTATAQGLGGESELRLRGGLRSLIRAAEAARGGGSLNREVIQEVEQLFMSLIDPDSDLDSLAPEARLGLRVGVMQLLETLPFFDTSLKAWASAARDAAKELLGQFMDDPPPTGTRIRVPPGTANETVAEAFDADSGCAVHTIHAVKGQSHGAALLIAVDRGTMGPNWTKWLGDEPEEVRVAYVALTRAQRYTALALPHTCPPDVVEQFVGRGFVLL